MIHLDSTTLALAGLLLTAVGALLGGGIAWGALRSTVEQLRSLTADLRAEVKELRGDVQTLSSEVAVLRALRDADHTGPHPAAPSTR